MKEWKNQYLLQCCTRWAHNKYWWIPWLTGTNKYSVFWNHWKKSEWKRVANIVLGTRPMTLGSCGEFFGQEAMLSCSGWFLQLILHFPGFLSIVETACCSVICTTIYLYGLKRVFILSPSASVFKSRKWEDAYLFIGVLSGLAEKTVYKDLSVGPGTLQVLRTKLQEGTCCHHQGLGVPRWLNYPTNCLSP